MTENIKNGSVVVTCGVTGPISNIVYDENASNDVFSLDLTNKFDDTAYYFKRPVDAGFFGPTNLQEFPDKFYTRNMDVTFDITINSATRTEWRSAPSAYLGVIGHLYDPDKFLSPINLGLQVYQGGTVPDTWKQKYRDVQLVISYKDKDGNLQKSAPTTVRARAKGFGRFRAYNRQIPLKIKSNTPINGLGTTTKLATLNNLQSNYNKSKLIEHIIYKIFRDYGLPAPRTNYIRLFINDTTVTISNITNNLITTNGNHYLFPDMRIKISGLSGQSPDQILYVLPDSRTTTQFKVSLTKDGPEHSLANFNSGALISPVQIFTDYGEYLNVENIDNDYRLNELFGINNTKHIYEVNVTTAKYNELNPNPVDLQGYETDYGDNNRSDLANFLTQLSSSTNWYQNISSCVDLTQFIKFSVIESYCGTPDGYCNYLNNCQLHSDQNGIFRIIPWGSDSYFFDQSLINKSTPYSLWMQKCLSDHTTLNMFKNELLTFHNWIQKQSNIKGYINYIFNKKINDFNNDKKKPNIETSEFIINAKNEIISFLESRQAEIDIFLSKPLPVTNPSASIDGDNVVFSWDPVTHNIHGDPIENISYGIFIGQAENIEDMNLSVDIDTVLIGNRVNYSYAYSGSYPLYWTVYPVHNMVSGYITAIQKFEA